MHLGIYLGLLHRAEQTLTESLDTVGSGHAEQPDVYHACQTLAGFSRTHVQRLGPILDRYGEQTSGDDVDEPDRLHADGLAEVRSGPVGLLRDLQDLHVLADLVQSTWTVVRQAAQALRDGELVELCDQALSET